MKAKSAVTDIVVGTESENDFRMNISRLHPTAGHVVDGSKDGSKNVSCRQNLWVISGNINKLRGF